MTLRLLSLTPPSPPLPLSASCGTALTTALARGRDVLPVADMAGRHVGTFRLERLLHALLPAAARQHHGLADLSFVGDARALLREHWTALRQRPLSEVLDREETVLREDTPLLEAMLLLVRQRGELPVLDQDGRLKGMVAGRDILAYLNGAE